MEAIGGVIGIPAGINNPSIDNFEGLNYFENLEVLIIKKYNLSGGGGTDLIAKLSGSVFPNLKQLDIRWNGIDGILDVSNISSTGALEYLYIDGNQLTDVNGLANHAASMKGARLTPNKITALDLSDFIVLEGLVAMADTYEYNYYTFGNSANFLTTLTLPTSTVDANGNTIYPSLNYININNQMFLTSLDLSDCRSMVKLQAVHYGEGTTSGATNPVWPSNSTISSVNNPGASGFSQIQMARCKIDGVADFSDLSKLTYLDMVQHKNSQINIKNGRNEWFTHLKVGRDVSIPHLCIQADHLDCNDPTNGNSVGCFDYSENNGDWLSNTAAISWGGSYPYNPSAPTGGVLITDQSSCNF